VRVRLAARNGRFARIARATASRVPEIAIPTTRPSGDALVVDLRGIGGPASERRPSRNSNGSSWRWSGG